MRIIKRERCSVVYEYELKIDAEFLEKINKEFYENYDCEEPVIITEEMISEAFEENYNSGIFTIGISRKDCIEKGHTLGDFVYEYVGESAWEQDPIMEDCDTQDVSTDLFVD